MLSPFVDEAVIACAASSGSCSFRGVCGGVSATSAVCLVCDEVPRGEHLHVLPMRVDDRVAALRSSPRSGRGLLGLLQACDGARAARPAPL